MNAKIAKLLEEQNNFLESLELSGNGSLPSNCPDCNGNLDFTRIVQGSNKTTILICRECGEMVKLDDEILVYEN